jgi:hypothetical protein
VVLICPFIASVATTGFGDSKWKSPFDICPAALAPLSLTNLQVAVGGQNVLNSTLNMHVSSSSYYCRWSKRAQLYSKHAYILLLILL